MNLFLFRIKGLVSFYSSCAWFSSLNLLMKRFNFKTVFFSDSLTCCFQMLLGLIWRCWAGACGRCLFDIVLQCCKLCNGMGFEPIPIFLEQNCGHWKDLFGYGVGLTLVRLTIL
jgi:hypothetical protein